MSEETHGWGKTKGKKLPPELEGAEAPSVKGIDISSLSPEERKKAMNMVFQHFITSVHQIAKAAVVGMETMFDCPGALDEVFLEDHLDEKRHLLIGIRPCDHGKKGEEK